MKFDIRNSITGANLIEDDLRRADFRRANLDGVIGIMLIRLTHTGDVNHYI